MTRYKAIIFDLDGTLVHSAPDLHSAANAALTASGRKTLDLATITSFIGNGVEKLVERCLRATGPYSQALHGTAMTAFMDSYDANMTTLTRPYPGVPDCLTRLKDNAVPLGICTNKPTEPARKVCDGLDLSRFFTVIIGAERDQARKPDPQPLLRCAAELRADPRDILYVGDSGVDHATAQNAGVAFRLFSGGYLKSPIPDLRADQIFERWSESGLRTDQAGFVTVAAH
ncbi:phosphoglycolate phosphatase [Sedimentitalea sp. JM2-8]|uniref:phosphoglycolate phosphatase n=1 Tax=Sedimentitalea xiamensis TaxID=3050037 RepID=A0ABT7F8X8_9RHOB|nr:phosphoglycolate phosphatase [Sedimentitalea xiamensis]MDK3071551.1 phosphoglycolate phosphatase [Sedimentitalea xiamensis]